MAVTSAASGENLEADMQRKMKIWGVIKAFSDGRMPDNHQIDKAMRYAEEHAIVDINKLSPEGRVLVDDTRDIIETLRMMVKEKNADEVIQNAVWASYAGDPSRAKQDNVVPVSKDDAKKDVDQAAAHMRVLITLFITNSEFRKILQDLGFVGRDIFASNAAKAAEKARPDQEQLDQIDKEAPSKQWIGADGQKLGTQETPDVALKGPDGSEVRYHPKDAPSDAKITDRDGNTRTAGEAYDQAQQAKQEAQQKKDEMKEQAKDQAKSHGQDLNNSRDPNASLREQKDQVLGAGQQKANEADANSPNVDRGQAKEQAKEKANQLKEKIPEEHREKVSRAIDTEKEIIKEAFPEERREQFIYRLKKVVVECQEHKDYMEAMSWLLDTLSEYKGHAKHVIEKADNAKEEVKADPGIHDATVQFRTLLERFANGKSMDGIIGALDQMYTDAQNDKELSQWYSHANEYVHKCLLEPGYILDEDADSEGRQLVDDGKYFFEDKYKGHQHALSDELELWFTALADDPLNQRLGEDVKRLTKDLLFNEEGNLTFKPKLWNDIRMHFLPSLIERIGYVPIPRAEYSDDKIDLVVENLILSGPNIFPNIVELEGHQRFKFSPYPKIQKEMETSHSVLRIATSQTQADIRDCAFAFRRKSGFPKISDHGLADVVIAGKGISVDIEIESVTGRRDKVFNVNHVKVDVDTLKFSIRDSKHDLLYKFVKATATNTIKKAIEAGIKAGIHSGLNNLHDQLLQVKNTVEDAKKSDDTTRTQALKDLYSRKKQTAQAKKQEADEKTGTFKLVTERDEQLNPDLMHDAKKSSAKRLFKTEDMAQSGREWHSPAFDLFDKRHPAVTGERHPEAVPNAGHKDVKTSAIDAARGHSTANTGNTGNVGQTISNTAGNVGQAHPPSSRV